jgi:hypothetical protein
LEVHSPLSGSEAETGYDLDKLDEIVKFSNRENINNNEVKEALLLQLGLPVNVAI